MRQPGIDLAPPGTPAPSWSVSEWLGTPSPLDALRGKVVVAHAFQMLCPGCVQHGLPQTKRVFETFDASDVAVVGLHTVFEHHDAMTPVSLRAFAHEYRLHFPIAIDAHDAAQPRGLPLTMRRYGMQGTPTLLLIDRRGDLRLHAFGMVEDLALGAMIARLLAS